MITEKKTVILLKTRSLLIALSLFLFWYFPRSRKTNKETN